MATKRRSSWSVPALNGIVAGTVLLLVAVLALVVKPPAPPGIAAFAPQANKAITKAPDNQSAQFGSGAGACGTGQVCAGGRPKPTAGPPASAAASAAAAVLRGALPPGLQCYAWPDGSVTQTFDPQSPPCISRWDDSKGNGGATWQGVTKSEIKVVLPVASANSTWPSLKPLVDFFNTRFQLYGRKIVIQPVVSQQADGTVQGKWNDPSMQRADAAQIAAAKPFATFDFLDPIQETGTLPVFLDAMAKARIVSVNGGEVTPYASAETLKKHAPYAWSYYPTIDDVMRNTADMTCRQLVGRPASHAPDPALRSKTRKFAVWIPSEDRLGGALPGLDDLLRILASCGVQDPKVVRQAGGRDGTAAEPAQMTQLKNDGVTSLIFYPFGGNGLPGSPLLAAQQVGYQPEWVTIGWSNYNVAFMLNDNTAETAGVFGVGSWNKQPVGLALEPWAQAFTTTSGSSPSTLTTGRPFYQELMLLASGIQMAGPHLTPETFAAALHSTAFPNPGAGGPPYYQAKVGFPGDDPLEVSDYTAFWLDTRTTGHDVESSPGINEGAAFCEVGLGRRWVDDTWPRADGYYAPGVCR